MEMRKLSVRLVLYTTLLLMCVGGLPVEDGEEVDGKELALYRQKLRECRNNLSELEEDREQLRSTHKEEKERLGTVIKACESRLADLDSNDRQLEVAREETELVRKELEIAQERLGVCDAHIKSLESREHNCQRDLSLAHTEVKAAQVRVSEAEKTLRQNDCSAARRDVRTYRDLAEQAEIDKEALIRRVDQLEKRLEQLVNVSDRIEETEKAKSKAETAQRSVEASLTATQAELDATNRALEALLVSLDARKQFESLLKQHEDEWLPHWLSEWVTETMHAGRMVLNVASEWISPLIKTANSASSKFYLLRIRPTIVRVDLAFHALPGWPKLRSAASQVIGYVNNSTKKTLRAALDGIQRTEVALENALIQRLQRVDSLKRVAHHEPVHYFVWGLVASILVPIVLRFSKAIGARVYLELKPGTVTISAPPEGSAFNSLEESLGYRFSQSNTLQEVFSSDTVRGRLSWLGVLVARVLAGELAFHSGQADVAAMERDVAIAQSPKAMVEAAKRLRLDTFVRAGPGTRSTALADRRQAELLTATLGAVYVDSEFDLKVARAMWQQATKS